MTQALPRFLLAGGTVVARTLTPDWAPQTVEFQARNVARFAPVSPARSDDFLTEAYWRQRLEDAQTAFEAGEALHLYLVAGDEVVGGIGYTQFVGPPLARCYLGAAVDAGYEGRGLLRELLPQTNAYVFDQMGVHRIEASHLPENTRSARLLRVLGFAVEGYARDYLLLDGVWRDHVLTARINPKDLPPIVVSGT